MNRKQFIHIEIFFLIKKKVSPYIFLHIVWNKMEVASSWFHLNKLASSHHPKKASKFIVCTISTFLGCFISPSKGGNNHNILEKVLKHNNFKSH
jgi:hypothetical protein